MAAVNSEREAKKKVYLRSPCMYAVEYTCTSSETVVTTMNITAVRPSTYVPTCSLKKEPASNQRIERLTGAPPPTKCHSTTIDMTRPIATSRMPNSAPFLG